MIDVKFYVKEVLFMKGCLFQSTLRFDSHLQTTEKRSLTEKIETYCNFLTPNLPNVPHPTPKWND